MGDTARAIHVERHRGSTLLQLRRKNRMLGTRHAVVLDCCAV